MRVETREEVNKYIVYITEDGKEFRNRYYALMHDGELIKQKNPRDIPQDYITLLDEDEGGHMYYCKTIDDLHYIGVTELFNYDLVDGFIGPGWYVAIFRDGGDGYDYYDVYSIKKYYKTMKKRIAEYESIMKEWEGKL